MRMLVLVLVLVAGCVIDPSETEISSEVTTRSPLERNCDALLRANAGSGCDIESGRQVCILTTAVQPARVLRLGDWIPSVSTLETCAGGTCKPVKLATAQTAFHCPSLAACLPIAANPCPNGGALTCNPDGEGGYNCNCWVLD